MDNGAVLAKAITITWAKLGIFHAGNNNGNVLPRNISIFILFDSRGWVNSRYVNRTVQLTEFLNLGGWKVCKLQGGLEYGSEPATYC